MRRLDIGIASYGSDPTKLIACVESIKRHSVTDWRLFIVHNPSEDDIETRAILGGVNGITGLGQDPRIKVQFMPANCGYAGAVNRLFELADTEYIAYLDNDAEILTPGWDETLASYLDRFHEIGLMFPNQGHYAINRGAYTECLWAAGFCWMVNRMAQRKVGGMDCGIGHHEEVDFCTRLRLAGYKLACAPEVRVAHHETSTRSPASQERINRGVVAWMNKWTAYFGGVNLNYHSPNVLRVTDWPVHALYLEDYFKAKLPGLNDNPESVTIDGAEYDLIRVPRPKAFYRTRII